ncbi:hypothetical protein WN51_04956 [Melipona quadrifasciata]|uniref:Uncharacterized protein n=1 Tax=Melipona quadrifasciata TaxID=166423 RepID=A0A0N0U3Q7_9HYME|nr:hypothetical protein WN51_04956 [Melipona quadrifasciata]
MFSYAAPRDLEDTEREFLSYNLDKVTRRTLAKILQEFSIFLGTNFARTSERLHLENNKGRCSTSFSDHPILTDIIKAALQRYSRISICMMSPSLLDIEFRVQRYLSKAILKYRTHTDATTMMNQTLVKPNTKITLDTPPTPTKRIIVSVGPQRRVKKKQLKCALSTKQLFIINILCSIIATYTVSALKNITYAAQPVNKYGVNTAN